MMAAVADLVRHAALEQHAKDMTERAQHATGAERDELAREGLAAYAQLLTLATNERR
jgi:phage shock protein A